MGSSASISTLRPSFSTSALTMALPAPILTSDSRTPPLKDRIVASKPTASRIDVFPVPLAPLMTVTLPTGSEFRRVETPEVIEPEVFQGHRFPHTGFRDMASRDMRDVSCERTRSTCLRPRSSPAATEPNSLELEPEPTDRAPGLRSGNTHRHEEVPVVIVVRSRVQSPASRSRVLPERFRLRALLRPHR